MSDYVATPDIRLVVLLAGLAGRYGKLWCYPSQQTILSILSRHYSFQMSRRTLNRHLGALESQGWIRRIRRHRRGPRGSLELHSTLYVLRRRALRLLSGLRDAGRRFGGWSGKHHRGFRCATSGTISVPSGQTHGPAASSPPPGPPDNEAARRWLAAVRDILAGTRRPNG